MTKKALLSSVLVLGVVLSCVLGFAISKSRNSALDLTLFFTAEANAQLEPCGCFTGQYGGLARVKSYLMNQSIASTLRVDVGNAIGGVEDYEQIRYKYVQEAFKLMEYDVLNVGARECQLSASELRAIGKQSPVPLVSANVQDTRGGPLLPGYQVITKQGYRIGVVGVVDSQLVPNPGEGITIASMETALKKLLPELRKEADFLLLLAYTDHDGLKRLAEDFFEFPVILGGAVPQPSQELLQQNRSLILYTTNETKSLGLLSFRWVPGQIAKVKAWDIVLMTDRIPLSSEITALTKQYRGEVRQTRLKIDEASFQTENQIPGVRPSSTYVGSERCASCHQTSYAVWKDSKHAHAFESLQRADSEADPSCIGCHTVGFTKVGGYHRKQSQVHLRDVGCESCHGPGSDHVEQHQSGEKVLFHYRKLTESDCRSCHHGKFSRPFDWETWWPKVAHSESKSN